MLNITFLIQLPVSKKGGTDVNVHFAEISDITIFTCVAYATLSLQSSKVAVSSFLGRVDKIKIECTVILNEAKRSERIHKS